MTLLFPIPKVWRKLNRQEVHVHCCVFNHAEHLLTTEDIAVFTRLSPGQVQTAMQELMKRQLLPRQYYSN